jgi:hypothetical protein
LKTQADWVNIFMPTVLSDGGFRVKINTDDHPPMHVHIWHQGSVLIVEFETEIRQRDNFGFSRRNERRALQLVEENREFLIREWRNIHG